MKKVLLTKSHHNLPANNGKCADTEILAMKKQVVPVTNMIVIPERKYEERKSQKSLYQELFSVLLRMPDKQVQDRVINAINGKEAEENGICKQCSRKLTQADGTIKLVDAFTQTEGNQQQQQQQRDDISENAIKPTQKYTTRTTAVIINDKVSPVINTSPEHSNASEINKSKSDESIKPIKPVVKRGRKRKTCVPQVVKRSHAQQVMQEREDKQLTPLVVKKKRSNKTTSDAEKPSSNGSEIDLSSFGDILLPEDLEEYHMSSDSDVDYKKIMAYEYITASQRTDGLLPIHIAVVSNDIQKLQRQIVVLTRFHNVDLNILLTDEDEDCLELSILHDCIPCVTESLLKANLSPNHIYEHSNNIIHLTILNSTEDNCLLELMERIDLNLLLLRNDDGYTPLHIALRHNNYRAAEIICDAIDRRTLGEPLYSRVSMPKDRIAPSDANIKDVKHFCSFYEKSCEQLDAIKRKHNLTKFELKRKFLDIGETRGGNSALFYAVENDLEHFVYFLLAHLSNPNAENHSGQSAKSFHYEFARTLHLNLKVARSMDKIVSILESQTTNGT